MSGWFSAGYLKYFRLGIVQFNVEIMDTFPKSMVGSQYFTIIEVKPNARNTAPPATFSGWMSCVRVDRLSHGIA